MIEAILNGLTTTEFFAYTFYMLLGVIVSMLSEQFKHAKAIKASGGFSIKVWIKENWPRLSMGIIGIFLGVVFMREYTSAEPSNFSALTLGLTLDVLIDRIFKRK